MIVVVFFIYLAVHLVFYGTALRHKKQLSNEGGIFLFHFIPAVAWVVCVGMLAAFLDSVSFAHVVLIGALHGIYSLTFLELWALADGGYSLAIMDCLEFRRDTGEPRILEELMLLGTAKKQERIADLAQMGLIKVEESGFQLTFAGRAASCAVAAVVRLANVSMSH